MFPTGSPPREKGEFSSADRTGISETPRGIEPPDPLFPLRFGLRRQVGPVVTIEQQLLILSEVAIIVLRRL